MIDSAALAKLTEQISAMQKQFSELTKQTGWLTEMSGQLQSQLNAIGEMGQISIPSLNLGNVANKIKRDLQCLAPDFASLMPSLNFDEMDFGSICDGRAFYKEALWFDPDQVRNSDAYKDLPPEQIWRVLDRERAAVDSRRQAVAKEVAAGGMAAGDLAATDGAEDAEKAASDLESKAKAANTHQERLAVIAQGEVLTNKQLVQQNQLLAQLLKVQSTMLMHMSTTVENWPGAAAQNETGDK
ncbi:MAG: hypothetical protein CMM61_09650 [Rhodospirillaceae bacterium]|nr:hypothetical protein [Rhodospirillaceae bacterium]